MTEPRYPGATENFRFSNSTLQLLLRCGLAYALSQEQGYRSATPAMVVGTAVAAAAELDNRAKIAAAPRLSLTELVDAGVAKFEEEVEESEVVATRWELDRAKDRAAAGSRGYGELLSPRIDEVLLAEEVIIAEIAENLELAGTVDCVQSGVVRDTKTGRRWSQERTDHSRQLSAYSLLYESRYGTPPARVAIDSLYEVRGVWKAETLWTQRSERELQAFVETAQCARRAITSGVFLPAPDGSWYCSHTWCVFWRNGRCKARPGA